MGAIGHFVTADLERRIQVFENKCQMLGISYREHKTNEYVWQQVSIVAGPQELLLSNVASSHGSTTSVAMIRCRRSYCRAPWTESVAKVDRVSRGRTTSRNGRAS